MNHSLWESYVIDLFENPILDRDLIKEKTLSKPGVYIWVNKINNQFYIGSSKNLYKRLSRYFQFTYLDYKTHKDLPVSRAIKKYGLDNFKLGILKYTSVEEIISTEQFFLDLLNPAYNVLKTAGLKDIKNPRNPMSEEQKTLLSLKRGKDHHRFGVKRKIEEIKKMRDNHSKTKKVYQFLSDKITFIQEYPSLREMTKITGISRDYVVRCIKEGNLVHDKWWFSYSKESDTP